jgi:ankyrin repeat protein
MEVRDESGATALVAAACAGHAAAAATLADSGADIDSANSDGQSGLYCAARQNHTNVVTALVDRGANVNQKGLYLSLKIFNIIQLFMKHSQYNKNVVYIFINDAVR